VRRQFRKNKGARVAVWILGLLVFVFVFADFLANDKPIVARYEGRLIFPVFKQYGQALGVADRPHYLANKTWKDLSYEYALWPPVPYGPREQDEANPRVSPRGEQQVHSKRWRHWMGTDPLGRDILSAIIHATRTDLLIGIVAMGVAALIGILLGSIAGFLGDDQVRVSRGRLLLNIPFLFLGWFYAFKVRSYELSDAMTSGFGAMLLQLGLSVAIFLAVMVIPNLLCKYLARIPWMGRKVALPLDLTLSRVIEVFESVPVIFLIIMVVAVVSRGSIFWVMLVIGLTRWTGIARFIRAELLRIRELEYIEAGRAIGMSRYRLLLRHAIPNSLSPVFIAIAFGIASAILIEAFLSFIGIGVPPDQLTWGSLLNLGRMNTSLWWLTLFPGIPIFITVTAFNLIGEGLTDALDPRQKKL
jgi:peptide/nickel transport system permease protein